MSHRGSAPGWRTAKMGSASVIRQRSGTGVYCLPGGFSNDDIEYVAFKMTADGAREALAQGIDMSTVVAIDEVGLWFSTMDESPDGPFFWCCAVPWSQIVAFGFRTHT